MLNSYEMRNEQATKGFGLMDYSHIREIAEQSANDFKGKGFEVELVEVVDEYNESRTIFQVYTREKKSKDELYTMLDHALRIIEMTNPEDGEKITSNILNGKGGLY